MAKAVDYCNSDVNRNLCIGPTYVKLISSHRVIVTILLRDLILKLIIFRMGVTNQIEEGWNEYN